MASKTEKKLDPVTGFLDDLVGGDVEMQARVAEYRREINIADEIKALRAARKMTQGQLADLVGTTQSVISRIESAEYEGHSLAMLERIARALQLRLVVGFAPPSQSGKRRPARVRAATVSKKSSTRRR